VNLKASDAARDFEVMPLATEDIVPHLSAFVSAVAHARPLWGGHRHGVGLFPAIGTAAACPAYQPESDCGVVAAAAAAAAVARLAEVSFL
jgi:hypothetical protein